MEIFSTAYLPGIHYIRQYIQASNPVIDLGEHFIKQTYRNRGVVCSSNGPLSLIVPLAKTTCKTTGEMEISYAENWHTNHIKSIRSCYKNSPYYEHYHPEFEELILQRYKFLFELNRELLNWILVQLEIKPTHDFSKLYLDADGTDYRNFDYLKCATQKYKQVFSDRNGFLPGCSVIDLLFNKGPEAQSLISD